MWSRDIDSEIWRKWEIWGKWEIAEEIFMKCDKMWEMWENNGEIEHGSFHRSFSVGNYIYCFIKRTGIITNLVGFL